MTGNAPRVTPQQVADSVIGESFTILPSGRTTICELTMVNGFTVRGESSVVCEANFDREIGEHIARADAVSKIWQLLGYALREELFKHKEPK